MKLSLPFSEFNNTLNRLGAAQSTWVLTDPTLQEFTTIEKLLQDGYEINIQDVKRNNTLFTVEGHQVVLYIKDHRGKFDVVSDPTKGNRFHMLDCQTLEDMAFKGRFDRYIATSRTDGFFALDVSEEYHSSVEEQDLPLCPCKNCLKKMNYQGYRDVGETEKDEIFLNFDIEAYFEDFSTLFSRMPKYTDKTVPINTYVHDWSRISQSARKRSGWRCESCKVNCSDNSMRKYLHTHHKDGQKGNNRPSNLSALCVLCHAEQPGHGHMGVSPQAKKALKKLRRQQSA